MNPNVIVAQPGWVLIEAGTGLAHPVIAWLPQDVLDEGPIVNRVQQLWPMALVDGSRVPCVLTPDRMDRGNLRLEYWAEAAP